MFDQLQSVFSGELYFEDKGLDAAIRTVYATDASEYQEKPLAVAIPQTIEDIKALIAFATEQKISLIPMFTRPHGSSTQKSDNRNKEKNGSRRFFDFFIHVGKQEKKKKKINNNLLLLLLRFYFSIRDFFER